MADLNSGSSCVHHLYEIYEIHKGYVEYVLTFHFRKC
jgi:hypothetical protein